MFAVPESFTWPVRRRAVAYVQVGDYLEMLLHRKSSAFSACEFCQTVNHSAAGRCRTCGGTLPAISDDAPSEANEPPPRARSTGSLEARSLRNALLMVLLPPLFLFAAFVAWYQLRAQTQIQTQPPTARSGLPYAAAAVPPKARPSQLDARLPSLETQRIAQDELDAAQLPPSPATPEPKSASHRYKALPSSALRLQQDPVASCGGGNFFSRAICINSRCAEPKAARLESCRDAVRQRRIDEARRNPTLMG